MHSCHTNPSTPDAVFCAVQRPGSPAMLLSLERQPRVSVPLLRSNGLRNKSDRTWVPITQKTALPVLWASYTLHGRKGTVRPVPFGTEQQRWLTKETEICHSGLVLFTVSFARTLWQTISLFRPRASDRLNSNPERNLITSVENVTKAAEAANSSTMLQIYSNQLESGTATSCLPRNA